MAGWPVGGESIIVLTQTKLDWSLGWSELGNNVLFSVEGAN